LSQECKVDIIIYKNKNTMKGLLKNLGLILIVIAAIILVACAVTGNVNNNAILGGSVLLMIVGLITYIVINKKITD
jgi:hypothetical protein